MTAARSDLMALDEEWSRLVEKDDRTSPEEYPEMCLITREEVGEIIERARLAASQPDREAVKEFIASASFASRSSLDSDTIFCEIYTPGYQPAKKGSFGFFVKELRAILSLLSGANTKSDGGVEGHATASEGASYPEDQANKLASTSPYGSTGEDAPAGPRSGSGIEAAGIKPGPSDPSPGPDVRRRVLDILNVVAPAVENLAGHQEQCDMDGVMVKVSRQALDEVLNAVNEVALVSALTRPLGGFVQGSIARKQSTDTEGSSRTETAGGAG